MHRWPAFFQPTISRAEELFYIAVASGLSEATDSFLTYAILAQEICSP
jgi:hypothetical protein